MSEASHEARDCFAPSYTEARALFLEAARTSGSAIESYRHPHHRAPSGEDLVVDVAVAGDPACERALMIVSGTHGVEAYAGSAAQVGVLRSELYHELQRSVRLILVHAINPFGFAYSRRTNEDNVDLNRNFIDFSLPLPSNPAYAAFAEQFLPRGPERESYLGARRQLEQEARAREGYQFLKRAMQPGQYDDALGLYYGGVTRSWSNQVFMEICSRHLRNNRKAAVLDIHTGLGPPALGEVIFLEPELMSRYGPRLRPPVSCAGSGTSVSSGIQGSLLAAAFRWLDADVRICCALEFGTVSLEENVAAKILENWCYHYRATDDPLRQESQKKLRAAYFCDTDEWKTAVLRRASEVVRDLHACLMNE